MSLKEPLVLECTLKNVNLRVEKHGEDDVVACDLSLETRLKRRGVAFFLDTDIPWWLDDEDGTPRGKIEKVHSGFERHSARVEVQDESEEPIASLLDAKVNQIRFEPLHHLMGGVTLRVQSTISKQECSELAWHMKSTVFVIIHPPFEEHEPATGEEQPSLPGTGTASSGNADDDLPWPDTGAAEGAEA